ncbi:hypothetical protein CAMGR0001_1202 [Campylobacter gracilis RM3268]|uniref:Uncharacterized protein n=1 Tax=Campylobacter gracilis RM3268 TaxID=553220 RepID=C8PJ03_9BACT|nr:hypothetical protein CAMGR0001_1202 [Campylobacter gracilis RM3268]
MIFRRACLRATLSEREFNLTFSFYVVSGGALAECANLRF